MAELSESYASPGLRWSLLLHDHPGATYTQELKRGVDLGLPSAYGGDEWLCVVTIRIPDAPDVVGYKPVKSRGSADDWNIAVTKTLGRALKKAGYPDDLTDLKALMHWRQRTKELAALEAGQALPAFGGAAGELVVGKSTPDTVGGDDSPDDHGATGDDAPDGIVDAEEVKAAPPEPQPAQPAPAPTREVPGSGAWAHLPEELRARVDVLPEREQGQLVQQLDKWGIVGKEPTVPEARKIGSYLKALEAAARAPAKAPRPPKQSEAPVASDDGVVDAEAYVEDAAVEKLLTFYENLNESSRDAVDKAAEREGLTWNFPMPVATFDRLSALMSTGVAA